MKITEWLSKHIIPVTVALLAVNFLIIAWGALNWGIYSARNSANFLRLDSTVSRNKSLLMETDDPETTRLLEGASIAKDTAVSGDLKLTCSDDDFGSAFAAVRPTIVNITTDRTVPSSVARRGSVPTSTIIFDDPAIRFVEEKSLGSGVIVDSRGFIITNAHVVSLANEIHVVTFSYERKTYTAEVVRKDTENDLAIIRIYPDAPLPVAILGDSDMIRVADGVLVVGSPFGLEQTVTAGIISDDSRNLMIESQLYEGMIQTDAAINRGNSGGALVNTKGEVIGITTAIYAPTGVFTGVGFAIPSNRAKSLVREVVSAARGI
ncbi:MAG: trypsin-like peptidase domain-containing protein [Candidatus Omnitrophica bacterium]|nr:trypsin-like peptidase domain-containing protein [Candidatus Omnitrophota bacterium]